MRANLLIAALLAGAAAPAAAADVRVIQNREYGLKHEFSAHAGLVPLDVLYKAPAASGKYTYHFNDFVAWEVLSVTYAPTTDLSLIGLGFGPARFNHFSAQGNELQDNFGFGPFDIDQFRVMAESNFVLKPLYGKFSLFDRRNMRVELFGTGGLAVANFVAFNPYPFDPLAAAGVPPLPTEPLDFLPKPGQTFLVRPGANVGGGLRWFFSKRVTFRLDGRAYGFLEGYNGFSNPLRDAGITAAPSQPQDLLTLPFFIYNAYAGPGTQKLPSLPLAFTPLLYVGMGTSITFGGS